ncbi:MAG: hypothetical protein GX038_07285 [Erysipelothrix sp.]|nr:hypothetical protein [Erysipelothrix sp.]
MEVTTKLVDLLMNNGVAVAVVAYFLWKDSKLTKENTEILQQVKAMLEVLLKGKRGGENESMEDTK